MRVRIMRHAIALLTCGFHTHTRMNAPCPPHGELDALVTLLDDPDRTVQTAVMSRLNELGRAAFPGLRKAQCIAEGDLRVRIGDILHDLHFSDIRRRWASIMDAPDADVEEGALLLAQHRYPDLDVAALRARLDAMADRIRPRIQQAEGIGRAFVLSTHICTELGFEGNHEQYSAPENSYINCVLDSRRGIPVSLCVLFIILGKRLGLPIFGVNMPAHFLAMYKDDRHEVYFDMFNGGNPILKEQCVEFLLKAGLKPKSRYFKAASGQSILLRLVSNLLVQPNEEAHARLQRELTSLVDPWKPNPNVHGDRRG